LYDLSLVAAVLPVVTVDNERCFSLRTAIKTKLRSVMTTEHLNMCLHVSFNTKGIEDFKNNGHAMEVLKLWKNKSGRRNIYCNIANRVLNLDRGAGVIRRVACTTAPQPGDDVAGDSDNEAGAEGVTDVSGGALALAAPAHNTVVEGNGADSCDDDASDHENDEALDEKAMARKMVGKTFKVGGWVFKVKTKGLFYPAVCEKVDAHDPCMVWLFFEDGDRHMFEAKFVAQFMNDKLKFRIPRHVPKSLL